MAVADIVSGIYRIRNVISGTFYIGSSESVYRRFEAHRRHLRSGKHKNRGLQQSWVKHGEEAFRFEIIVRADPADLREVERRMLVPLLNHPKCCNMHDETFVYPRTGTKHSEATKAKISAKVQAALAAGKGGKFIPSAETRAKMSAANRGNPGPKGHVRSEEHRQRLSEANKGNQNWLGKKHSEEAKAKMGKAVRAYAPDGTVIIYPRTTAIKEQMGILFPTLQQSIRSGEALKKGAYKGWRFEYLSKQEATP